jgi:hypothetical protein
VPCRCHHAHASLLAPDLTVTALAAVLTGPAAGTAKGLLLVLPGTHLGPEGFRWNAASECSVRPASFSHSWSLCAQVHCGGVNIVQRRAGTAGRSGQLLRMRAGLLPHLIELLAELLVLLRQRPQTAEVLQQVHKVISCMFVHQPGAVASRVCCITFLAPALPLTIE